MTVLEISIGDSTRGFDAARVTKTKTGKFRVREDVRFQQVAAQVKGKMIAERIKDFSPAEFERCLGATVAPETCLKVAAHLVDGGLTIRQLYEGVEAGVDDVFNVLTRSGKDLSMEDAAAVLAAFAPDDHFAFLTARTNADAFAVIQSAAAAERSVASSPSVKLTDRLKDLIADPVRNAQLAAAPATKKSELGM